MKNFYTLLVVLFPLLASYRSPVPGIDFATFTLVIFIPVGLYCVREKTIQLSSRYLGQLFFWILIFFTSILHYFSLQGETTVIVILRYLKFVVLISSCLYFCNVDLFQKEKGVKLLIQVAKLSSVIIIIQQLAFSFAGIAIELVYKPWVINSLYDGVLDLTSLTLYRPTSFFLEPAYFSQYVVMALVFALYHCGTKDSDIILLYIGVLMSTSGSGIIIATLLIVIHIYNRMFSKIRIEKKIAFVILVVLLLSLSSSEILKNSIDRIDIAKETGKSAFWARMGGYLYILNEFDITTLLIGNGLGNIPPGYFNGVAYIVATIGVVGLLLYLLAYVYTFYKVGKCQRLIIIVYIYFLLGAQVFSPTYLLFFLSLVLAKDNYYIKSETVEGSK